MMKFIEEDGTYKCTSWDSLNGEDDVYFGRIIRQEDGFYFIPSGQLQSFSCRHLRDISNKLSDLNINARYREYSDE